MGFRFYKSFKLFPGVRVNLSKSGLSATVGIPGANINFGSRGTRTTLGIPGSGLSYVTQQKNSSASSNSAPSNLPVEHYEPDTRFNSQFIDQPTQRKIQSESIGELSSSGLEQLLESTKQLAKQRADIADHIRRLTNNLGAVSSKLKNKRASLFRFFYRKNISKLNKQAWQLSADLEDHKNWLSNSKIELEFISHPSVKTSYGHVVRAFENLRNCHSTWDVTADKTINKVQERSAANKGIFREKIDLKFSPTDFFSFHGKSMQFENANGEDIHILPEIIFMLRADGEIALIEIKELELEYSATHFIEEGEIPSDSELVGQTWAKVNKNGKPDLRFINNYEIPILRYGEIQFRTKTGLFELYQFSNSETAREFAVAMTNYINSIKSNMNDYRPIDY
jgi:Protein of unknown function (DUF4236)